MNEYIIPELVCIMSQMLHFFKSQNILTEDCVTYGNKKACQVKVYCSILSLSRMYIVLGQTIGELGLIFKHANIQSQVGNIPRAQYALHEENEFERNYLLVLELRLSKKVAKT